MVSTSLVQAYQPRRYSYIINEIISESQYPSEISIRGRAKHWFNYTVQEGKFKLDGFNEEGRPIFMAFMKKLVASESNPNKYDIVDETDAKNLKRIYLTHDQGYYFE